MVFPLAFIAFKTLSQLGLPSSAHDFLLVTLLTYAYQHSVFSTLCLVYLSRAALGNCLNRRAPLQQLRVRQVVCGPLSQGNLHTNALSPPHVGPLPQSAFS